MITNVRVLGIIVMYARHNRRRIKHDANEDSGGSKLITTNIKFANFWIICKYQEGYSISRSLCRGMVFWNRSVFGLENQSRTSVIQLFRHQKFLGAAFWEFASGATFALYATAAYIFMYPFGFWTKCNSKMTLSAFNCNIISNQQ